MADGFAAGLASGLRGLPEALHYGLEKRRRDAYQDELAGAMDDEGNIDYRAAAKIAGRHRDVTSMRGFSRLADERAATARTNRDADQALLARRVMPYLSGKGDPAAVSRLVQQNPGIVAGMVGLPEHRKIAGIEVKENPETGQQMWALRIANSRTKSTGPMTRNASADPKDEVMWMTPNQIAQGLSPYIPRTKGAGSWRAVDGRPDLLYNQKTGETRELPRSNTEMSAKDYAKAWDNRIKTLLRIGQFGDTDQANAVAQEIDQVARRVENESGGKISGLDVLSEAAAVIRSDNEISEGLFSGDLEQQQLARSALLRGILVSMGYMQPEAPAKADGTAAPEEESSESILDRLFGESEDEDAAAPAAVPGARGRLERREAQTPGNLIDRWGAPRPDRRSGRRGPPGQGRPDLRDLIEAPF